MKKIFTPPAFLARIAMFFMRFFSFAWLDYFGLRHFVPLNAPKNYWNFKKDFINANMPLEAMYSKLGNYSISSRIFFAGQGNNRREFKVWFPSALLENGNVGIYPAVIFSNGTSVPYFKCESIFEHLASWGFVTVGNIDCDTADGSSPLASLDFIFNENADVNSIFYNKLDFSKIGISGHSQGAIGAVNACNNSNGRVKSIYAASMPHLGLARALGWDYSISDIRMPCFINTGTLFLDGIFVSPLLSLRENFNGLDNGVLRIAGRRKRANHTDMLYVANGYMVAWFLYTLCGDTNARGAFVGDNAEIFCNSDNWSDILI